MRNFLSILVSGAGILALAGLYAAQYVGFVTVPISVVLLGLVSLVGILYIYIIIKKCHASSDIGRECWFLTIFLLGCITFGVKSLFSPSEDWMVRSDQGLYIAQAQLLFYTGNSFWVPQPQDAVKDLSDVIFVEDIPGAQRDATSYDKRRSMFPHYYAVDEGSPHQRITPMFPSAYPLFIAGWMYIFGEKSVKYVNHYIVILSALSLVYIMTYYFSVAVSILFGVAFLVFPLNVWGANHHYAEPLLCLFWLMALSTIRNKTITDLLPVICCSPVLLLIKIDGALGYFLVFIVIIISLFQPNSSVIVKISIALLFVVISLLSIIILLLNNYPYYAATLRAMLRTAQSEWFVCYSGFGIMIIFLLWKYKYNNIITIKMLVVVVFYAIFIYLWAIRPLLPLPEDRFFYSASNSVINSEREYSLWRLGWYLSHPLLLISVFSLGVLYYKSNDCRVELLALSGFVVLIYFGYDLRNRPEQPYAFRRFHCYAYPALFYSIAYSFHMLIQIRKRVIYSLCIIGVLLMGCYFSFVNNRINTLREFNGVARLLKSIRGEIKYDSMLLVHGGSWLNRLSASIIFPINAHLIPIQYGVRDKMNINKKIAPWLKRWLVEGRCVYMITSSRNETFGLPVGKTEIVASWEETFVYRKDFHWGKGDEIVCSKSNIYLLLICK